jgi:stage V sporulation protein AA
VHIHVRLQTRIHRPVGTVLFIRDVAQLVGPDSVVQALNGVAIRKAKANPNTVMVIDIMQVISLIQKAYPEAHIQTYGDCECIVDVHDRPQQANVVFIGLTILMLFLGSGLAIMDFHADVGMAHVHRVLYRMLTGHETKYPYWIQVPYSLGLGLGMIVFFNRWFKKKVDRDPNPLDIEMQTYQDNVNKCVIAQDQVEKAQRLANGGK